MYPRRVTEAFVTSDGRFFENREDASRHEMRFVVVEAVRKAVYDARYHKFGEYVRTDDARYIANLVDELQRAGLGFAAPQEVA